MTWKPFASRCAIHFLQQPQLASRCTSMVMDSTACTEVMVSKAAKAARRAPWLLTFMEVLFAIAVGMGLGGSLRGLLRVVITRATLIASGSLLCMMIRAGCSPAMMICRCRIMVSGRSLSCLSHPRTLLTFANCGTVVMTGLVIAMLTFMVMHLAFSAAVLVARAGCHQGLVLLGVHLRQLVQEGNHAPDVLVTHALAPSRHARGFDAVLDNPEGGGWISIDSDLGEVWRRRIKCLAELSLGHAGCQVATNTHGVVV